MQTEARISIFKNAIMGHTPRDKGFANRQLAVARAVLTHNLWLLARMRRAVKLEKERSKPPPEQRAA